MKQEAYLNLLTILEELVNLYKSLFDAVKSEEQLLISAEVEKLSENNKIKESLLLRLKNKDAERDKQAQILARCLGLDPLQPRLLKIAEKMNGSESSTLRAMHSTLELLINKIQQQNKNNEVYTESALRLVGGALDEIKGTLQGKKTYGKKGTMAQGPERAGNFVSKEA